MGDHLGIIILSSVLLILLNSLISLRELHKTPNVTCSQIHPLIGGPNYVYYLNFAGVYSAWSNVATIQHQCLSETSLE